jgi:threonine/homoserine/homoserine lactone efflux protein
MSAEVIKLILFGMTCGLTAGFAPGPVTALVVSQTLKYNFSEGLKIAIAPMLTDLPIVAVALLILSRLSQLNLFLGVISLVGALVVLYMGISNLKIKTIELKQAEGNPKSIVQGMATNFFQPHPHVFWFGVGAPAILSAWPKTHIGAVGFLSAFLICIVGAKLMVAGLVKASKGALPEHSYLWILRGLGALMVVFAVILAHDGLKYVGAL